MDERSLDLIAQGEFEYAQKIRKDLIVALTPEGKMPNDKENQVVLLQTLRDMDAQNIQRLRIKVEDKAADNLSNMSAVVSTILREINPKSFEIENNVPKDVVDVAAKFLPESVPAAVPVEGEMAINPPQENYDDFVKKMKTLN